VPTVVEIMAQAFPELKRNPGKVAALIQDEEESFIRTLDRGIKHFQDAETRAKKHGNIISGKDAFKLHDTYGLYIDIIEQMAAEANLKVDREGYQTELDEARTKARGARKKFTVTAVQGEVPATDDSAKYGPMTAKARLVGWVKDNKVVTSGMLEDDEEVGLLLDRTNFYAEQGGQVGDAGVIRSATGVYEVRDTQKLGDAVLHVGWLAEGSLAVDDSVTMEVSSDRPHTMRNHTSTHLLNWALREVLGDHIEQKGSLVDADKTRFDFTHDRPLSPEEIQRIEFLVNEKIYADLPVTSIVMPLGEAKKIAGVRAVFGEKYPDPVRVLLIGPEKPEDATRMHSVEFCGGTHLTHTGQAGFFKILAQEGVAKGVRRVTAVTGQGAVQAVQKLSGVVDNLTGLLNCKTAEVGSRVEGLLDEIKKLQAQLKKGAASDLNSAGDQLFAESLEVAGARIIIGEVPPAPIDQIRAQLDRLRQKAKSAVVVVGWVEDGKVGLLSAVTEDLTRKIEAGKLIGEVARVVGGKGGGRKDMAQAGGSEPTKLPEALALARTIATEKLG
jgi:alanyl-tRNA synthetase